MRHIFTLLGSLLLSVAVFAAETDTVTIHSATMNESWKATVTLPDAYQTDANRSFPVVYMLHGHSGNFSNYTSSFPELSKYADELQLIVVCPDGDFNSWYIDSPIDPKSQFETYISKEVVKWVDQHYRTIQDRKGRAITGLSMGGHGALYLAAKHADTFGAAASMSGGVDFTPWPLSWQISKKLGPYKSNTQVWESHTVIANAEKLKDGQVTLFIDCGVDDFFIEVNRQLHQKLLELKYPHIYMERPGEHNWDYWNKSVPYHLAFFDEFFDQSPE
ncbi:alpha/beta hydrolase family protein [Limibacter armeniacum]|uniref:alpha/beta hydrolase n=1 Tax=Limibacter armeniacum TaxID=466084 RepID=UPI002FE56787